MDIAARACHRIGELRAHRGWSLEQLAVASGVSRSMLSQIEREQANPTLAVTLRIAQAFEMSLGELVEADSPRPIEVIRARDQKSLYRSDDDCDIRTLSPLHLEKDVEMYEVKLRPNRTLHSAAHFEGTREFLTVQQGKVQIDSGDNSEVLSRGDSASYRADVDHSICNLARSNALVILAVIYA
jgi:transcriptional regulator with XRE-family HTH domain